MTHLTSHHREPEPSSPNVADFSHGLVHIRTPQRACAKKKITSVRTGHRPDAWDSYRPVPAAWVGCSSLHPATQNTPRWNFDLGRPFAGFSPGSAGRDAECLAESHFPKRAPKRTCSKEKRALGPGIGLGEETRTGSFRGGQLRVSPVLLSLSGRCRKEVPEGYSPPRRRQGVSRCGYGRRHVDSNVCAPPGGFPAMVTLCGHSVR